MNLSTMLQHGDGCTRDLTEFKRWCVRAPTLPGSVCSFAAPPSFAIKARSPLVAQAACRGGAGPGESNRVHQEFRQLRRRACA
jgi:hypothetical protein